jgi:hypothetical protein
MGSVQLYGRVSPERLALLPIRRKFGRKSLFFVEFFRGILVLTLSSSLGVYNCMEEFPHAPERLALSKKSA